MPREVIEFGSNCGPFDRLVYLDAQRLESQQLIAVEPAPYQRWDQYRATPAGLAVADRIREQAPAAIIEYVHELVDWARSLTFEQLVSAVYEEYPGVRKNSIFRGSAKFARPSLHNTPEGELEQEQRSVAETIRERTLLDPEMLELLEEARRCRERVAENGSHSRT